MSSTRLRFVVPVVVATALLAGCSSGTETGSGGEAATGGDFYTIDGVSLELDGGCSRNADDSLLAKFDATAPEDALDIMGLPQLQFSAESGAGSGRASFGIRQLAPDLIAESFDGTTAHFQEDFDVVIGDGVITGSGTFLDWTPIKEEVLREIEFRVACEAAGDVVEGPAAAEFDVCAALEGIDLPATPASYEQVWDDGRDASWVDSTLGVEIGSCTWHATSDDGIEDVVQVTFLPDGHEWADPAYYEHPEDSPLGYTLQTTEDAYVWLFPGGAVNNAYFPVDGGVVSVGSTYPTFAVDPYLDFAREAVALLGAAR